MAFPDSRSGFFRHLLLGRFPSFSQPVVRPLYQHLPLAFLSATCSAVLARIQVLMLQRDIGRLFRIRISSPTVQTRFTSLSSLSASSGISPYRACIKLDGGGRRRRRQSPKECKPKASQAGSLVAGNGRAVGISLIVGRLIK